MAVGHHLGFVTFGVFALRLVSVAAAQQPAQLVIANVRVFTGARGIDRATITVADGKILSIAAPRRHPPPSRSNGTGKTALRGLIDTGVHMLVGITEADTRAFIDNALKERVQAFLRYGVTTVKSAGDPTDLILGYDRISETERVPGLGAGGPTVGGQLGEGAITLRVSPTRRSDRRHARHQAR